MFWPCQRLRGCLGELVVGGWRGGGRSLPVSPVQRIGEVTSGPAQRQSDPDVAEQSDVVV